MTKKIICIMVMCCTVLSFGTASCGTIEEIPVAEVKSETVGEPVVTITQPGKATEEAVVSPDMPEYGGIINLCLDDDPVWDLFSITPGFPQLLAHQRLFDGDWTKGSAGGYGEALTDWDDSISIPGLSASCLAVEMNWELSGDGTEVNTTFILREDVKYADLDLESGNITSVREVTIDDLIWNWNQRVQNEKAQYYQLYPNLRPEAIKISSNTFAVTFPFDDFLGGLTRINASVLIFPPEEWDKYGYLSCTQWKYSIGTGPFVILNYAPGSMVDMKRNPDYWMTDPVGPGQGNQLPYADKVRYHIIKDENVRLAALRTAGLDRVVGIPYRQKNETVKDTPELLFAARGTQSENPLFMRTDTAPFNDINVRKALMLATDFNTINETLYDSQAEIASWPYYKVSGYELLSVNPKDSDVPIEIEELYVYDSLQARYYLAEGGYPYGFKTSVMVQQSDVEYYSMIAEMWAKVGIILELEPMDYGSLLSEAITAGYEGMIVLDTVAVSSFPEQAHYASRNWVNASLINDEYIDEQAQVVRDLAVTDFAAALVKCRSLVMYLLGQAYVIPAPRYPLYTLWWPWLKNYSGEVSVGYFSGDSWAQFVWVDRQLKAAMGY